MLSDGQFPWCLALIEATDQRDWAALVNAYLILIISDNFMGEWCHDFQHHSALERLMLEEEYI